MAVDVPQWLSQAYVRSVQAAGSEMTKQDLTAACFALVERWSSPDRRYHGVQHVIDTLTRIETLLPATHAPDLVRLAAWYHGVVFSVDPKDVYTRNGGENEVASAAFAEKQLVALGVDPASAARVGALIRYLRHRESEGSSRETAKFTPIDVDGLALRDAHLGCLAVEPQRYRRYLQQIREEYESVSDIGFCRARRTIVHNLLHRRPLFITPLARPWEEAARDNLEAENERLTKRLKELEAFAPANPRIAEPPLAKELAVPLAPAPKLPGPALASATSAEGAPTEAFAALTDSAAMTAAVIAAASGATGSIPAIVEGEPPAEKKKAPSPASQRARMSRENLLRYTAEEDAAEEAQKRREQERRLQLQAQAPARKGSTGTFSSLETISDRVESPDRAALRPLSLEGLNSEEKKKRKREQIQAQMRQRISERQRQADQSRKASSLTRELRAQGFSTGELERISGFDSGELRRQGYSTGSIPRIVVDDSDAEIATPTRTRAAAAGAIHVAPTATSAPKAREAAPTRDAPADEASSALTPIDADSPHVSPGFGMEREPKED